MGERIASNEDIVEHLNQLTNDDAAALIRFKKQQTKGESDLALATSLKENFPEIDLAHPTRLRKYCDDFLKFFDGQRQNATRRAERKLCPTGRKGDFIDKYSKEGRDFRCTECGEFFARQSLINKHIKNSHLEDKIEELLSQDESLLDFQSSPFTWTGIKSKSQIQPQKRKQQTKKELLNENVMIRGQNVHLQNKIRKLEASKRANEIKVKSVLDENKNLKQILAERPQTPDTSVSDDDDENKSPTSQTIELSEGQSAIIIDRASSINAKISHGQQITANENFPGGKAKKKVMVATIPVSRPKARKENSDEVLSKMQKKRVADNVAAFNEEAAARAVISPELATPARLEVMKTIISREDKENVEHIVTPLAREINKVSPELQAQIITEAGLSRNQIRKMNRAANNLNKKSLFCNEKAIEEAKKAMQSGITRDMFAQESIQLQIRREGEQKKVQQFCPIVYVKDMKVYMETLIRSEAPDCDFNILPDGSKELICAIAADAGGGSMKFTLSILNNKDQHIRDHIIMIFEASDSIENLTRALSRGLLKDLKNLNESILTVDDEQYFIKMLGVFDYKAQHDMLGKQGSTSTSPCSKCNVSLTHLQQHPKTPHSEDHCSEQLTPKNMKFYDEMYKKNFVSLKGKGTKVLDILDLVSDEKKIQDLTIRTLDDMRKNGKKYGNVVGLNLLPFSSLSDICDPALHLWIGLNNDCLKAIRKECQILDSTNANEEKDKLVKCILMIYDKIHKMQSEVDDYYYSIEDLEKITLKRLEVIHHDEFETEKIAYKYYEKRDKVKLNRPFAERSPCSSQCCIIFPVDERMENDPQIKCTTCENKFHLWCEGLTHKSQMIRNNINEYKCTTCEKASADDIKKNTHKEIRALSESREDLKKEIVKFKAKADELQRQLEKFKGKHEKQFEDGFRTIGTEQLSYHGGQLNGKDCEKVMIDALKAASVEEFEMTKCLLQKSRETAQKHWKLFRILGTAWSKLRAPAGDDTDISETVEACREWSRVLPVMFPDRNITLKGHSLSIHVPQFLMKHKGLYNLMYKVEQQGESIHNRVNRLNRRYFCVKPDEKRLILIIEALERSNNVSDKIFEPRNYTKKKDAS